MIPKWLVTIVSSLQKTVSGPEYISPTYVQFTSHICIKYKVHNFKGLSFVSEGGGEKKNEIMVEDRETLWRGWDVKANLLLHASVSSCDTI